MTFPDPAGQWQQQRTRATHEAELRPFIRSPQDPDCELYWISVPLFPAGAGSRSWLIDFFVRLDTALMEHCQIRGEFFLQFKTVGQVEKRFRKLAPQLFPQIGLSRRPNAPLPRPPTLEQLQAAMDGAAFDVTAHYPDYCFWLRHPEVASLLKEFFGIGGSAMYYLKPDPATKPIEIPYWKELCSLMPQMPAGKMEALIRAGLAMKDGFLPKSKELFGAGLEDEPEYDGFSYILPLLETRDFFTHPPASRQKWFELFDVFWRESPADEGIYIASSAPLESLLIQIVQSMKKEGNVYPNGL
jgi:hypothetical protein